MEFKAEIEKIKRIIPKKDRLPKPEENLREEALRVFQRYRRRIESDKYGFVECISCGRMIHFRDAQGGHYIPKSESKATELESDNVWPQCPCCNAKLNGNSLEYRKRLVKKIGFERVMRLENMRDASLGDKRALMKLSQEDQIKALRFHSNGYYRYKKMEYENLEAEYMEFRKSAAR